MAWSIVVVISIPHFSLFTIPALIAHWTSQVIQADSTAELYWQVNQCRRPDATRKQCVDAGQYHTWTLEHVQ